MRPVPHSRTRRVDQVTKMRCKLLEAVLLQAFSRIRNQRVNDGFEGLLGTRAGGSFEFVVP
jgi:hypothetical protein